MEWFEYLMVSYLKSSAITDNFFEKAVNFYNCRQSKDQLVSVIYKKLRVMD